MVQRKLFLDVKSHGIKPENRFSNLTTSQELKKKKMKRTRPTRLKDSVSQPGKPPPVLDHKVVTTMTMTPLPQKQSVAKVTDGSPNYMKGTTSSEARRESVPRNVRVVSNIEILRGKKKTGAKLGSGSGIDKQSKVLCRNSSLKMTKTPSFKRCSRIGRCSDVNVQRATCSSTLKDSKFPEYLVLSPGGTEAEGTSVFKVCPYTYCSLNGHLHAQYPPLKSFISARRRALKSQRGMKLEASSPRKETPLSLAGEEIVSQEMQKKGSDGFVEIYVPKQKESEQENAGFVIDFLGKPDEENRFSGEGDGQVSESLSDGAPRSEIDSEESFGFYHDIFGTNTGNSEEMDSEVISEITDMEWEGDYFKRPGVGSNCAEMVNILEGDGTESKKAASSDGLETLLHYAANGNAQSGCCEIAIDNMLGNLAALEKPENASEECFHSCNNASENTTEGEEDPDVHASSPGIATNFLSSEDQVVESTAAVEIIVQTNKAAEMDVAGLELNNHMQDTLDDSLTSKAKGDAGDADTDESDKDVIEEREEHGHLCDQPEKQAQDSEKPDKQKMYGNGLTEESQEIGKVEEGSEPDSATEETFPPSDSKNIQGVETKKIPFTRARKSCNQDQPDDCNKWIIKCKRTVEDIEDLRAFNPREPNYLPIASEPDAEKVDLKHQDMDERKNAEDWMIDYALQRAVSKLAPARKRKVALLVEAFETVMPVPKCQTHVKEPSTAFTCGRPLQACN